MMGVIPAKAVIQNLDGEERIEVMFNPTQYTSTTKVIAADTSTGVQFQTVTAPDFTVDLFFDTYEAGEDVRTYIDPIALLQEPTVGVGDKRDPPTCMFSWGRFHYAGLISNLEAKFTLFKSDGTPVRAEVKLTFKSVLSTREMMENAGLDNCRKLRVIKQSDRLDLLANETLGTPADWRDIASANDVDDPLKFPTKQQVGTIFVIPDPGPAS